MPGRLPSTLFLCILYFYWVLPSQLLKASRRVISQGHMKTEKKKDSQDMNEQGIHCVLSVEILFAYSGWATGVLPQSPPVLLPHTP